MLKPQIHIVHEWLVNRAGSELVIESLLAIWPKSPIHTLVHNPKAFPPIPWGSTKVHTSFFQRWSFLRRHFRLALPLMPLAVARYNCTAANIVISSTHAVAHLLPLRPDQLHIAYVHTPMRYAFDLRDSYLNELPAPIRPLIGHCLDRLAHQTHEAARRVHLLIANSHTVAERIQRHWGRTAVVVPPPVSVERFRSDRPRDDFYCTVGRLVGYKRTDLAVEACARLDKKLIVIGDGPELPRLKRMAGPKTIFLGAVSDAIVSDHLERCRAFLFGAQEDFGIAPVEAMAAGAPVIAYDKGGASETVKNGISGLFFDKQEPESMIAAINICERNPWNHHVIRKHACGFSRSRFQQRMCVLVDKSWKTFCSHRQ